VTKRPITVSVDRMRRRRITESASARKPPPDDRSCPRCKSHFRNEELVRSRRVCPVCAHHFPVSARERVEQLADGGAYRELWPELRASDPLQFVDLQPYPDRVERAERGGSGEAILCAEVEIGGHPTLVAAMDFAFLGGSMGAVVGEKLARAADACATTGHPLVVITASGGARMQEGVLALMQMAKTVVAVEILNDAEVPVVVVLAHPTTGGVWASFASLGDVTYAEPGALIAFSGPRVIEQTTREVLPDDFGRAETQLANGQVDAVVDRRELPARLAALFDILDRPRGVGPAPAVTWAHARAETATRVAQGLPAQARRLVARVIRPEDAA
jgi:acetyl-CoA carboxylase carboxyl transferase subunit beta